MIMPKYDSLEGYQKDPQYHHSLDILPIKTKPSIIYQVYSKRQKRPITKQSFPILIKEPISVIKSLRSANLELSATGASLFSDKTTIHVYNRGLLKSDPYLRLKQKNSMLYHWSIFVKKSYSCNIKTSFKKPLPVSSNTNILQNGVKNHFSATNLMGSISLDFLNLINKYNYVYSIGLHYSNRQLSATIAKQMAKKLKRFKKLQGLSLWAESSRIGEDSAEALASTISNFKDLITLNLNLSMNQFQSKDIKEILNSILNCSKLQTLALKFNQNSAEPNAMEYFTLNLYDKCPKISSFEFSLLMRGLNSQAISYLAQYIKNSSHYLLNLSLNLSYIVTNNVIFAQFCGSLSKCQQLKSLKLLLQDAHLEDENLESLRDCFQSGHQLRELDLNLQSNNIKEEGSASLSQFIQQFKILESVTLILGVNQVGNEGAKKILKSFQNVQQTLQKFQICFLRNGINDSVVEELCELITNMKVIKDLHIYLAMNEIKIQGAELISKTILKLKSLENLSLCLQGNPIGDLGVQKIIRVVPKLDQIYKLDLNFTDCQIKEEGTFEECYKAMQRTRIETTIQLTLTKTGLLMNQVENFRQKFRQLVKERSINKQQQDFCFL